MNTIIFIIIDQKAQLFYLAATPRGVSAMALYFTRVTDRINFKVLRNCWNSKEFSDWKFPAHGLSATPSALYGSLLLLGLSLNSKSWTGIWMAYIQSRIIWKNKGFMHTAHFPEDLFFKSLKIGQILRKLWPKM